MKMTPGIWEGKPLKENYVISVYLRCIKGEISRVQADDKQASLVWGFSRCFFIFFTFLYLAME